MNFASGNATYGTLLSGATAAPGVLPAEVIAVTAQMVRTTGTVTTGVFTHSSKNNIINFPNLDAVLGQKPVPVNLSQTIWAALRVSGSSPSTEVGAVQSKLMLKLDYD